MESNLTEMRAAMELWEQEVDRIVHGARRADAVDQVSPSHSVARVRHLC
jgi:hypothetical protein